MEHGIHRQETQKDTSNWEPSILAPELHDQVWKVVLTVAERLSDERKVSETIQKNVQNLTWEPASLASGFCSLVLPFLYLARATSDKGWSTIAHHYLRRAANHTHQNPYTSPSLFFGSSGIALVTSLMHNDEERYLKSLNMINEHLQHQIADFISLTKRQITEIAVQDYDALDGASGILGYLILIKSPNDTIVKVIHNVISYLIWLSKEEENNQQRRWYISSVQIPSGSYWKSFSKGYFNCGMAHGIPGPLAALSLAWNTGYRFPGQIEAISSLSQWLIEHSVSDKWGINWPGGIPLHLSYAIKDWYMIPPARTGWCYGSLGVARSLWLAGLALNDACICDRAIEAMEAILERPTEIWGIDSPTFCHGFAGLLSICLRFAQETKSPVVQSQIPKIINLILDCFSPHTPFGFQNKINNAISLDDPGLLTGAAGVILSLLAATTPCNPDWNRVFLIA